METITIKPLAELLGVNWQTVEIGTCRVPRVGGVDKEMDKRKANRTRARTFHRHPVCDRHQSPWFQPHTDAWMRPTNA